MADFPRAIEPTESTPFFMPGALQSWGQSGKGQHRSTMQMGRQWLETYPAFKMDGINGRALLAFINDAWMNGTSFTMEHYSYRTHNGGGTGTILVNGASQTGTSLITDGWAGANPVLRAGDIITVAGLAMAFDVTADVNRSGVAATIPINPAIFAGNSPANNAAVTITGVKMTAVVVEPPNFPRIVTSQHVIGMTVRFREVL